MQNLIFGTDGIRGIANQQLSASLIFFVGKSLAIKLIKDGKTPHSVIIARDNRPSSDMIFCALSAGLMSLGVDIIDVGITTTPALSYMTKITNCGYGIMITASHNPVEYNGIKIFDSMGHKIDARCEQEIVDIYNNIESYLYNDKIGRMYDKRELIHKYLDTIIDKIGGLSLPPDCKIIIDCANGAGGHIMPYVYKTLIGKCDCINCQTQGNNINKECGSVNIDAFVQSVKGNFDIGFAFDGDGDRLVVVLKDGSVLRGQTLLYIMAKYYKEHNLLKNNCIATTILTSIGVEQALDKLGITTYRSMVGDKHVWEMMKQRGAILGGEDSGHIIIDDIIPTADAMFVSLTLLKIFGQIGFDIQNYTQDIVKYETIEQNIQITERQKNLFNSGVLNDYISLLDSELGANTRLIVRASGTESVVRILIEGRDKTLMSTIAKKIAQKVLKL